ncbi:MAG TPA: TetR/AcrR family transcriptional regulator [Kribbellaceae bacterium]
MTDAVREPKQDRSRATRARVLEATVESLAELGWSGTTVAVVAQRAGVSRGATQHHFPTREDLVTAAIDYMSDVRMAELREEAGRLPDGPERTGRIVEMLVRIYTGPLFRAAIQVWAAAVSDPELKARVQPLEAKLAREAHQVAIDLLGVDESRPGVRETVQATLDLARGLGLADVLADDSRRRKPIVAQWGTVLAGLLDAAPAAAEPVRRKPRKAAARTK